MRYGGAKTSAAKLRVIKEKFPKAAMAEIYAATEFYGHIDNLTNRAIILDQFETGNLGNLQPNVEMKIVDLKSGKSLPAHTHGEICFRGPPCFIGYLNNEEATRSTIDAAGWYHSGDVGYYDHKGNLFITDRIKEMIKYKLYSLIPAEIEDFLHRHEAVEAVCVVGVPHVTDGNLIRAYVKVVEGKEVDRQHFKRLVAGELITEQVL